jgi:O-antigen/teichoic acid export membrane protein
MPTAQILFKSFFWKVLQNLTSVAVSIIFARKLHSSGLASFYSLVYILSLASGFFTLGLDVGLNYFLSKRKISLGKARSFILWTVLTGTILSAALIPVVSGHTLFEGFEIRLLAIFALLSVSGNLLTTLSSSIFAARGKYYWPAIVSLAVNCVIIVFGFASSGSGVLQKLTLLYFLCSFLQGLLLFGLSFYRTSLEWRDLEGDAGIRTILRFSISAFMINFLFFAGMRLTVYLTPYWVDSSSAGNYLLVFRIMEYLQAIVSFVYFPFMALVAGSDKNTRENQVLFMIRLSNTFVLMLLVVILAGGSYIFPWLFGPSFDKARQIFIECSPGLFAACASTFFTAYFFGTGRLQVNFRSAMILFSSMLLFSVILVPRLQVAGAAIAFSGANILSFIYEAIIFNKLWEFRFVDILLADGADLRKSADSLLRATRAGVRPYSD